MYNRLSIKVKEEKKRVARKLQGILAWNPQLLQSFKEEKWELRDCYSAWGKASAPGLRGAAVCPRAAPMGTVGQGAAKSCVLGRKELRAAATHAGMVQGAPWEIVNL